MTILPPKQTQPAVLIVEDEALVRMFAADALVDAGYRVFEAGDAYEALQVLETRNDISALVTDIEMPGAMNGLALAAIVRRRWPSIAVLLNSGRVRPGRDDLPEGTSFLGKPYRPDELIGLLLRMTA